MTDAAVQARLRALEAELRSMRGTKGSDALAKLMRLESVLKSLQDGVPALRRRLDEFENQLERLDQVSSAVGRIEILSSRIEELEEHVNARLETLESRGETLARRLKDTSEAAGIAEWREELRSLRREMDERFAEESAAQPWRDEVASLSKAIQAGGSDTSEFETGLARVRSELDELANEVGALRRSGPEGGTQRALQTELEALRVRITELDAEQTNTIDDSMARVERRLSSLEEIRNNDASVEQQGVCIEEQSERIEAQARTIAALEARLANLEAAPSVPAPNARADDLTRVKGIGPKFARALVALGEETVHQLAQWSDGDVDRIASALKVSAKRVMGWRASAVELNAR